MLSDRCLSVCMPCPALSCLSVTLVYCGQVVGWVKIPRHRGRPQPCPQCVRWGPSSLPQEKRGHCPSPIFGPRLLWPNGWMVQDATWYGGRPQPRPHCVTWGPSSPPQKGGHSIPLFGPCILWPSCRPSQQLLCL